MLVSSANSIKLSRFEDFVMSFIYTKKRRGPKIDPWGTPQVMSVLDEFFERKVTNYFLFDK